MNDFDFCVKYAEDDLPHRALLLYCLKSGAADILYCGENGILLFDKSGGHFLLSAKDRETARDLIEKVPQGETILAHEAFYDDHLQAKNPIRNTRCNTAAYLEKEAPEAPDADIRQLTVADLPLVVEHYHLFTDEEYFTELLSGGQLFAVCIDGSPAGFIGQHDSGEMGLLEVFEPYRNRGLGLKLEQFMIRKVLSEGKLPVGEVVLGNTASYALQRKAGMTIDTTQTVTWWRFQK